jgi:hypothetical protein
VVHFDEHWLPANNTMVVRSLFSLQFYVFGKWHRKDGALKSLAIASQGFTILLKSPLCSCVSITALAQHLNIETDVLVSIAAVIQSAEQSAG